MPEVIVSLITIAYISGSLQNAELPTKASSTPTPGAGKFPADRRRLDCTCRNARSRLPSPLQGSVRSAAYARRSMHAAASFFLGSRMDACWQEVWPCHENKSSERCDSRASSPHIHDRMNSAMNGVLFSSVVGQWLQRWPVLPVVALSERALSMPTYSPAK